MRQIADALSLSHVYIGEVERGRRRILPRKYWKKLALLIPGVTVGELEVQAAASEPIDPVLIDGPSRDVVIALARTIDEEEMSDSLAQDLLDLLNKRSKNR